MQPNFARYTAESQEIARQAYGYLLQYQHSSIEIETITLAMLEHPGEELAGILSALQFDQPALIKQLQQVLRRLPSTNSKPPEKQIYISPLVKRIIETAFSESERLWDQEVSPRHFFLAIIKLYSTDEKSSQIGRYLAKAGLTYERVLNLVILSPSQNYSSRHDS